MPGHGHLEIRLKIHGKPCLKAQLSLLIYNAHLDLRGQRDNETSNTPDDNNHETAHFQKGVKELVAAKNNSDGETEGQGNYPEHRPQQPLDCECTTRNLTDSAKNGQDGTNQR